jgi:hypothetical protein
MILMCGFKHVSNELPCSRCVMPMTGEFGNCPTSGYIVLCHYPWRWLSTSRLEVWAKKLCLFATNNIDYFGCDYRTCYFTCVKGFTFKNVVNAKGLRWSNIEGTCVQSCTMSFSQCGWLNWPIFSYGSCWPTMYVVLVIFKNHHYVDLWSMFLRLAHGMSHATNGRNVNWQMVYLWCIQ